MSAEGPARKPTSEPPDVDSLMSRLDGEGNSDDRISDPGSERRPSAAELLGGRGRRSKRGIRVPDDAVPAASPPSQPTKRSVPPPPPAGVANQLLSAPSFFSDAAVRSQRIISVGGPPPSEPVSSSAIPAAAPVPASEPTPIAPAVAAIAPGVVAPVLDPLAAPPLPALGPSSDVRLAAAPATVESPPIAPPRRSAPPPPPVRTPTPYMSPFANNPALAGVPAVSPSAVSTPPPAPVPAQILPPDSSSPATSTDPALRGQVTLPNLDAQVREALALLDREDFETSIDISVQVEEAQPPNGPQSGEESLADEELEVVERPVPSKKAISAPNPPPRRAQTLPSSQSTPPPATPAAAAPVIINPPPAPPPMTTLPSAAATSEPTSQPPIVVAAAATAVSGPAAGPAITTGPISAPTAPIAPPPEPAEIRKKKRQWFEELFNDDFARTLPRLDPRFLEREVSFIEDALGCDKGATILDLGCGPGEQAVSLASRGYEVIGVDLSLAMLARASDEAAEKGQRINFLQGDMRDLTFDEAFDGIYCFNTTFGYFDDTKNAEVIQKIHRALRRGGRFLLDVVNRDYIAPRTPSMVWFEGDGCVCMDEVQLNGLNSRLVCKRTMMMEDGRQREIEYAIRLYALHELGKLLHDNGFRVAEVSGDTSTPGSYFGSESPRILILAEKR